MSGTSVDAIDAAVVEISPDEEEGRVPKVLHFEAVPWQPALRARIFAVLAHPEAAGVAELCRLNAEIGAAFAEAADAALRGAGVRADQVAVVGSHGQTVWHDVDAATGRVTSTLQIGDGAVIAERTGITTVCDFRVADVAAGGQGAPLVSVFDWHFLRAPAGAGWTAVQNIGGIGNVTLLPDRGERDAQPIAFDTGPGNALIDWAAAAVSQGRLTMDEDGRLAREGHVHAGLLAELLADQYFSRAPPKTTGRELFGEAFAQRTRRRALDELRMSGADFVATLTELTARSIVDALSRFSPRPVRRLVVAGGGALNPALMARLRALLPPDAALLLHRDVGVDAKAKEALVFAYLAHLCVRGRPANVPSCTGARGPRVLGKVCAGRNYASVALAAKHADAQ
jgi:anhydro-N-acetylmuramic acid kinase